MASIALHADVVGDQSAEGLLLAYKMWSDSGKNFVGARPTLKELYMFLDCLDKSELENEATEQGTELSR